MCCKVKLLLHHSSFPRSPVLMECFEIWVEPVKLFSITFDNDTQLCEDLNGDRNFAKFVNYCCSGFEGYFADRRPADFISC